MKPCFNRSIPDNGSASGFTLIEVLISLTLFLSVALPMATYIYANNGNVRSQESLIATWLLEQESASIRLFSDDGLSTRRRVIAGKEWTIQVHSEGAPLVRYTLTALRNGKKQGELVVYGITNK